uniref:Putative zinc-finger domain-containing protein n=1 Tax=Thermosporothrix sp. COM3 TaxID=2490863 RepID=A0A455SM81_9CHLR|nr:hypothetical protein KTC_35010 [Thermosporothrix sp. COM3]
MNCEQVRDLLSAYLDGMLAGDERSLVASHLVDCQDCHSILIDYYRFDTLLTLMPRIKPTPSLSHNLFSSREYYELLRCLEQESFLNSHHL